MEEHARPLRRRGAASILKELLKKPIFLSTEAGACSTRAETLSMTLLHHACLTGALDCAALLLRARLGSGVFLFEDPDGLFDVRGRTPRGLRSRQFHKLKVLEVLSDARAAGGDIAAPPVPRGSMRTAQWWAVWRALAVPAVEAAEHLEEFLQVSETEIGSGGGSNDHGGFVATARATTAKSSRNHSKDARRIRDKAPDDLQKGRKLKGSLVQIVQSFVYQANSSTDKKCGCPPTSGRLPAAPCSGLERLMATS